jgi:hypothetical protein
MPKVTHSGDCPQACPNPADFAAAMGDWIRVALADRG